MVLDLFLCIFIFVSRTNANYIKQYGTTAIDNGMSIAVSTTHIYVTGYTGGTFPSCSKLGGDDVFISKYDLDGNLVYHKQFGSTDYEYGNAIALSATHIYVTGYTAEALSRCFNLGNNDVFFIKKSQRIYPAVYTSTHNVYTNLTDFAAYKYIISSNDKNILAMISKYSYDKIYVSFDLGVSWSQKGSLDYWSSIAGNHDFSKLVAATQNGYIYTSIDTGDSWVQRTFIPQKWVSVTSSSDGNNLAAVADNDYLYTSTNSGSTWEIRFYRSSWKGLASSSDGMKLYLVATNSNIHISYNGGITRTYTSYPLPWISIACSSDGQTVAAITIYGDLYISFDYGNSWNFKSPDDLPISYASWNTVLLTKSGNRYVMIDEDYVVYNNETIHVAATAYPTSSIPTSSIPTSSIPTSSIPTSSISTSSISTSSTPTSSILTSSIPTSSIPTASEVVPVSKFSLEHAAIDGVILTSAMFLSGVFLSILVCDDE